MSNSLRHRNFCSRNTELPIGYCKFTPGISSPAWWYTSGTRNWHIIEAKLEKGFEDKTGTQGILEDSRVLRGKTEINLARTLVIPKDRLTLARVANSSDRPIRLRTDLPVAEYDRVSSEDDIVVSLEPDPDSASVSHPSSIIDKPVAKERSKGGRKVEVRIARWPRRAFGRPKRAVCVPGNGIWGHICKRKLWFRKVGSLRFCNRHQWL